MAGASEFHGRSRITSTATDSRVADPIGLHGIATHVRRIEELEQRLSEARNKLTALAHGPVPSSESDSLKHLESGYAQHLKERDAFEKKKIKGQVKVAAI